MAPAYGGAFVAHHVVKLAVGRPRPGFGFRLVRSSGEAFPSGHATQSAAVCGALVVVGLASSPTARRALYYSPLSSSSSSAPPASIWACTG